MRLDFKQTNLQSVKDINIPSRFYSRMVTGIKTVDDFLHEGFLPGSTMTLTAAAGCGKTTWMLQVLEGLSRNGYNVGYCSGEENIYQLAMNAKRIGCYNVKIANMTDVDEITKLTETHDFIVVDSFQALTTKNKMNYAEKERYCVTTLIKAAQKNECCICMILHLTKAGKLKGSTQIPHAVDANMNIVTEVEVDDMARKIWFSKNRFGPTNEMTLMLGHGGFDMTSTVVNNTEKKYVSKKNAKEKAKQEIIKSQKNINSLEDVAKQYNISIVYAGSALRELVDEGKLKKVGRGKFAQWSVVNL